MLYVAPMMAWTDRHCRYLHRLCAPSATLFTEMVADRALTYGDQWHLLNFDPVEHPVVLQLGGNDPATLARCTREAFDRGFDEVNLNVGCPSDRVQNGAFGACLMKTPDRVAQCVAAMAATSSKPVTVKCRLGVDGADSDELLHGFIATVAAAGCRRFYVHARIAILKGLSPAQNREIPPLEYPRVQRLKEAFPRLEIILNGGITDLASVQAHLQWADGVMIGRAAYHDPALLAECHRALSDADFSFDRTQIISAYREYAADQLAAGVGLRPLIKPLLGLCNGMPGARAFRRTLSDPSRLRQRDPYLIDAALAHVFERAA
jgi:tRNA-dihydrouridine synthase A